MRSVQLAVFFCAVFNLVLGHSETPDETMVRRLTYNFLHVRGFFCSVCVDLCRDPSTPRPEQEPEAAYHEQIKEYLQLKWPNRQKRHNCPSICTLGYREYLVKIVDHPMVSDAPESMEAASIREALGPFMGPEGKCPFKRPVRWGNLPRTGTVREKERKKQNGNENNEPLKMSFETEDARLSQPISKDVGIEQNNKHITNQLQSWLDGASRKGSAFLADTRDQLVRNGQNALGKLGAASSSSASRRLVKAGSFNPPPSLPLGQGFAVP